MTKRKSHGKLKAVILVGGLGTRLRPLTDNLPKPMVPVINKPAMEHVFSYLRQFGIEDIILAMNYLPDVIKGYFGDGSRCGVRLTYCLEKEPLGTAGAVKNVAQYLDSTFFVINVDDFTDANLATMLAFHYENKAKATILLTWVEDPSAFGVVETDKNSRVKRFIEKPPRAEATTHWINAGYYILEPDVLNYIPAKTHYMFERGLFPGLLEAGEPVYGYPDRDSFWVDIGTPSKYFSLNTRMLSSETKLGNDVRIHPSADIKSPVLIGDGCMVAKGVRLKGPVIIGRECRIEEGAVVENSILWDNVTIGTNAKLVNCIVSSWSDIKANQEIEDCIVTPSKTVPMLQ
jgi:mannose-1-phosphate guanylyltransferase